MTLIIFVFFAIVAFVVGANAVPTFHHRDVDPCGGSWYNASQYDCLPNNQLCPIINGESSKECGSACYSEYQYTYVHALPRPALLSALSAFFTTSSDPTLTHSLHQMHRQRTRHSTSSQWPLHPHSKQPNRPFPWPKHPSKQHALPNRDTRPQHLLSGPRSPH